MRSMELSNLVVRPLHITQQENALNMTHIFVQGREKAYRQTVYRA
jgi:hypothetical protein